ncbi:DNA/RNA helicase domain-containing protein [Arthrobacter russicus]|uniref:DUF2075 family protein n=1 Tax=Arthrobacter russicus TaxID=172040 RepID=A0ABU1JHZ2_9MICC|nr:DNA/RNA helicase domain-containing protein [Arthrobacter russicus]MDR6271011.1 DUF2075 family protein [Arthrobacter russicus]
MTNFRIDKRSFLPEAVRTWVDADPRHENWPVVYTLNNRKEVYVGESLKAVKRMRQHRASPNKKNFHEINLIIGDSFNKSACLDLESFLIKLFAGDKKYQVLNRNEGIIDADYFNRAAYQDTFHEIFEELRRAGMFTRKIPEIENSELYKLSPFKALNPEQASTVTEILEALFQDIELDQNSTSVVQGDPGTGKTIVAIYLMKLLRDIAATVPGPELDSDSFFADFFLEGHSELLQGFHIGLVVPQQSLRKSIQRVFDKTPGLAKSMVLTPFNVGESKEEFDLLIVDETHRLNQRANQSSGAQNKKFIEINQNLFGNDDSNWTQLDWIKKKSKHQILLLDTEQTVRPADLPRKTTTELVYEARSAHRHHRLQSQMRLQTGGDYIRYIHEILGGSQVGRLDFPEYELRMFDDFGQMQEAIRDKDAVYGLSRLIAGYAWPWASKREPTAFDIELDGRRLRWNSQIVDWISSPGSLEEVGSIHTVQGYDLNYAGVIIGNDLRYDPIRHRTYFDRASYFDVKGKENNRLRAKPYSDDELLKYIVNVYRVLMTRGMKGSYLYVCDPDLREYLRQFV